MEPQEGEGIEFWNSIALEFGSCVSGLGIAYRLKGIDVRDWEALLGVK